MGTLKFLAEYLMKEPPSKMIHSIVQRIELTLNKARASGPEKEQTLRKQILETKLYDQIKLLGKSQEKDKEQSSELKTEVELVVENILTGYFADVTLRN